MELILCRSFTNLQLLKCQAVSIFHPSLSLFMGGEAEWKGLLVDKRHLHVYWDASSWPRSSPSHGTLTLAVPGYWPLLLQLPRAGSRGSDCLHHRNVTSAIYSTFLLYSYYFFLNSVMNNYQWNLNSMFHFYSLILVNIKYIQMLLWASSI